MAVARWYPSKIDWWLAIVLALGPIISVAVVIATLIAGTGTIVAIGSFALLAAIYAGLVFPMRYGIDTDELVIRHGLVRQRIPLSAIKEVAPTRNPLSSPALSLDRLEIKHERGFFKSVMISPAARTEFLTELADRAGLRREGERLVRA